MTESLNISSFGTIIHDEGDADLIKLLKRLANKRSARNIFQREATGRLKATAFGTSNE